MFGGSLSPPGVRTLLYETEEVCCTHCTTRRCFLLCSADLFRSLSVFPSLSLSVCRSLSPSSPLLCSLSSPSPGVFLCLCCSLHPPACCPLPGISPFARRCAQQRVEEPHGVSGYRVCLPEERSLEQP